MAVSDDLVQKIKESLLEDLISKMSDQGGDRLRPKGMSVEVAAPDKAKLADGLDKAKEVLGAVPESDASASSGPSEDDDEQRLMQLLGEKDDDDEDALGHL